MLAAAAIDWLSDHPREMSYAHPGREALIKLRLAENFRAVFYAPFYATLALGHFASEGLDVSLVTSTAPGGGPADLREGRADVTWGGPMRVMKYRDAGGPDLLCFCEVVRRDPFYLVGRPSERGFNLRSLSRLRLGSVSEVPTPWLCLQQDLRDLGIDPAGVSRFAARTMGDNLAGLGRGDIDVAQVFEPFAEEALSAGFAILHAQSSRGPTSYTTFTATPEGIRRHRDAFTSMTRAVARTQAWLLHNADSDLAQAVGSFFPSIPVDVLARAFARYMQAGVWAGDTGVSREGFSRLGMSLRSGGFISSLPDYDACVVNLPA
jgi:NitT/TauT family transport system substrate-binding protein